MIFLWVFIGLFVIASAIGIIFTISELGDSTIAQHFGNVIMFLIASAVVFIFIVMIPNHIAEDLISSHPVESSRQYLDSFDTTGSFSIGRGLDDGTPVYYYFVKSDGANNLDSVWASNARVFKDTNDRPYIVNYKAVADSTFWSIGDPTETYKSDIHVPADTKFVAYH